jgi:flagellar assembly factor FliW
MRLTGTRFGAVDYEERDVLQVAEGLVGMPQLQRFLIMEFAEQAPFRWLQSVDEPSVGFLIADPVLFDAGYNLALDEHDLRDLEVSAPEEITVFVLCTRRGPWSATTGNLLGPVIVHTAARRGRQIIVEDAGYSTHAPLRKALRVPGESRQRAAGAGAEDSVRESVG